MFDLILPPPAIVIAPLTAFLISLAVSALLAGASYLLRPKTKAPVGRKVAPTYSERGSFIPRLLGTQRLGAVIAWIGNGLNHNSDGGKTAATQPGWHIICVGPVSILHQILEGGKVIFPTGNGETLITRESHPSGSLIILNSKQGRFRIYWGEDDQPIDSVLAAGTGIASRWPSVCYVVWDTKRLNTVNQWPELHYVVTVKPRINTLDVPDHEEQILAGSDGWMPGDAPYTNDGVNPAHALVELLTDTFPHGVGLDAGFLNTPYFEDMGALLETEGQPCNIVLQNGEDAQEMVSKILTDTSFLIPQVGDKLLVLPIRALAGGETYPTLEASVLAPPYTEKVQQIGLKKADRLIFQYQDRAYRFKDNTIVVDNDGEMIQRGAPKTINIDLDTVIDKTVAATVADRRQIEDLGGSTGYKYQATRGARLLVSGQRFTTTSDDTLMRVISVAVNTDSPLVEIEAVKDIYAPTPSEYVIDPTTPPVFDNNPYRDEYYDFIELPYALTAGKRVELMVLRQRVSQFITSSVVSWGHFTTTLKEKDDDFNLYHTRGTLIGDMDERDPMLQLTGPEINLPASNIDEEDFTTELVSEQDWRTGKYVAIINNEWFFFRQLVHVSGTTYRLDGLIRSRWTTTRAAHSNGDVVWLTKHQDDQAIGTNTFTQNLFARNQNVYLEVRPKTDTAILSEDDAEPLVNHTIQGLSLTPLRPANFRADEGLPAEGVPFNTWLAGGPVTLKWSNRSRTANGYTAGTQSTGDTHTSSVVKMDGELRIRIRRVSDNEIMRTLPKIKSGTTTTYTYAQMMSDFGTEPASIYVEYWQQIGPYESEANTILVTKRS